MTPGEMAYRIFLFTTNTEKNLSVCANRTGFPDFSVLEIIVY